MDQIKIGRFIEKNRKKKGLTQNELAEYLGITDRAISKWENGRGLPDHSLLLKLTDVLGITVNELLLGEYIEEKNFKSVAEQNLVNLAASSECFNKELGILEKIICVFQYVLLTFMVFIFILNMVLNYIYPDSYNGWLFEAILPLLIIFSMTDLLRLFVLKFKDKYKIVERKK